MDLRATLDECFGLDRLKRSAGIICKPILHRGRPGFYRRCCMNKNDHTAFRVSDLDVAIRFYTESLGLRLLFRNVNNEEHEAYAFLQLEGGTWN